MKGNRMMQQVTAIFSTFMVLFYLGVGFYLIFVPMNNYRVDKSVLIIIGSAFIFYGLYRAYRAYVQIIEAFFSKDKEDE